MSDGFLEKATELQAYYTTVAVAMTQRLERIDAERARKAARVDELENAIVVFNEFADRAEANE